MKSQLFVSLFTLYFLTSCGDMPRECMRYHTGKFSYEAQINGQKETTTFYRNDSLEISTFRGVTDSSTVSWVSDCEYILRKLNPKNFDEQKAIQVNILSISDKGYYFEYGVVGDLSHRQRGYIKLIP